jgi:preprotein translocase subunit SecE
MADERDNERDDDGSEDSDASGTSPEGVDAGAESAERAASDDDFDKRAEVEAEAERAQLAREAEALSGDDDSMAALLGPERWVQFAFIAIGVSVFFLAERLTNEVWSRFSEPDAAIVSAVAAALAILGTFLLYRHPPVNQLADEVVGELAKVTWPTRDEVWVSTIVVVATSVIAAVYTGLFDAMWSALTNLLYG